MPATVTATLKTTGNANLQGNSFCRFRLRNFSGFVPRVNSTGVIVEPTIDAFPDGSGDISQSVYMNSEIVPATTFYTIEFWDQGRIASSGNYLINGATDLDIASQLNSPPVPPGFSLVLQNNGQDNSSQNLLNLTSDNASVTITDLGDGQIDLSASGGGAGVTLQNNGNANISQTLLNLTDAPGIKITNPTGGEIDISGYPVYGQAFHVETSLAANRHFVSDSATLVSGVIDITLSGASAYTTHSTLAGLNIQVTYASASSGALSNTGTLWVENVSLNEFKIHSSNSSDGNLINFFIAPIPTTSS